MFNTELVTYGNGNAEETFSLISVAGGKSIRAVSGRDAGEPKLLTVSHQTVVRGVDANGKPANADRHLMRIDFTEKDANSSGVTSTLTVYLVVEKPQDSNHTVANVQDTINRVYNALTNSSWAGLTKFLNNEP